MKLSTVGAWGLGASPFLQETLTYASPLITNQLVPSPTSARETSGSVGAPLITEMSAHCTLVYIWNVKKGKVRRHAWQELLFNCLHFLGFKSILMCSKWRNTLARLPVPFQNVASFAFTPVTPLGIDANLAAVVLIGFTLVQICNGIRKCSCWYVWTYVCVQTYTLKLVR